MNLLAQPDRAFVVKFALMSEDNTLLKEASFLKDFHKMHLEEIHSFTEATSRAFDVAEEITSHDTDLSDSDTDSDSKNVMLQLDFHKFYIYI